MTKVAGVLLALIVVGIVVTTRTHGTAAPICPATATSGHVTSASH